MTPEQTVSQPLGLGKSWQVVRTEFEEKTAAFVICVEETAELWPEESSRAGATVSCYDHVEPMQWRHLNVFNKECVIVWYPVGEARLCGLGQGVVNWSGEELDVGGLNRATALQELGCGA